jgi:hypothetical protein
VTAPMLESLSASVRIVIGTFVLMVLEMALIRALAV